MNRTAASLALAGAFAALCLGAAPVSAQNQAPAQAQTPPFADPLGDRTVARKDAQAAAAQRFDLLDANHDGALSSEELAAARPQRPPGEAARPRRGGGEWKGRMMGMVDANHDGKVTKDEFVAAQLRRFDRMDADHDGELTAAERKAAIEAMRARMAERMAGGAWSGGGEGGGDGSSSGD